MSQLEFMAGGGQVGALMRAHDWSTSPLGDPRNWPHSLRTVAGLLLQSQFPMFVAWGKELGFLYNDSYAAILGAKHPKALGSRFHDIWSEIWSDISPLVDAAMTTYSRPQDGQRTSPRCPRYVVGDYRCAVTRTGEVVTVPAYLHGAPDDP